MLLIVLFYKKKTQLIFSQYLSASVISTMILGSIGLYSSVRETQLQFDLSSFKGIALASLL